MDDCENLLPQAHACLLKFVAEVPVVYSENEMVYNMHVLIHLADYVGQLGPLEFWSAFKFESFLYFIKKRIHRPSGVLAQVKVLAATIKELNFETVPHLQSLSSKYPNNFVSTNVGVLKVTTIEKSEIMGYHCVLQTGLKHYPYPSEILGIGLYKITNTLMTGRFVKKCVAHQQSESTALIIPYTSGTYFS